MSGPEIPANPGGEQPKPALTVEELRVQLNVLERKLLDSKEPVVREALQMRISQIMQELGPDLVARPTAGLGPEGPKKKDEEPLPEAPSVENQLAADNLIRQARVCKMRGQVQEATDLVRQAADLAPGSAVVLEMLGDEYMERKRFGEARAAYKTAHRLDPTNVALETKFANVVLRTEAGMSFEMAMTKGDSLFLDAGEATASAVAATVLSVIVPGTGQLVLGENKKGFSLLGGWVLGMIFIVVFSQDLQGLLKSVTGRHGQFSGLIFIPIVALLAIYIMAIGGCASRIKKKWTPARLTEKPVPPVDLPFD